MNLFQYGNFTAASGKTLKWKFECDALSDDDWLAIAHIMIDLFGSNAIAYGVPTGGNKLAAAFNSLARPNAAAISIVVDDVFTTGHSLEKYRKELWPDKRPYGNRAFVVLNRGNATDPTTFNFEFLFQLNGKIYRNQ